MQFDHLPSCDLHQLPAHVCTISICFEMSMIRSVRSCKFPSCTRWFVVQEVAIQQVNQFLRESGGVIKIEDVLPLFPDFVKIDNFKDAICQSLEDYNKQIDQLKTEMEDATRIADALRCVVPLYLQRSCRCDMPTAHAYRPVCLLLWLTSFALL